MLNGVDPNVKTDTGDTALGKPASYLYYQLLSATDYLQTVCIIL